jgi:ATP synthase protein I
LNTTSSNSSELAERTRRIVGFQILASVIIAIGFLIGVGAAQGRSALYGGLVAVALTALLSRGVKRAEATSVRDPQKSMVILYIGAVQRFVLALAAFALGLAVLKLEPMAVFIGFAAAQFSYLINARGNAPSKRGV